MPPYVLTDADGEPIPGESYSNETRAIDARVRVMETHEDGEQVTVEDNPTPGATRKHLYLVTKHYNDDAVGCVEFFDGRHETVEKNAEGTVLIFNTETHDRKQYTAVGLGYYDFDSEDDYEERGMEIAHEKLREIDADHLEKAGVDLENMEAPA